MLNTTVAQGALNINGTSGSLSVGAASSSQILRADYWMNKFQLYSRALDASGLADAMNTISLPRQRPSRRALSSWHLAG